MTASLRSIDDYYDVADRLRVLPTVVTVDVLERDPRVNRPVVEIVVGPGLERIPPVVVRVLGEGDLGVRDVSSRPNGHFVIVAV